MLGTALGLWDSTGKRLSQVLQSYANADLVK